MIRIGTIWDRTTEVIGGRLAILAGIAALLLFLPAAIQGVFAAFIGTNMAAQALNVLLTLAVLACTIWASLAIVAVASDPATDRAAAMAAGAGRLPAGLAILGVAIVVALVAALPGLILFLSSGIDFERARAGLSQDGVNAGRAALGMLYFLVLGIVGLWISARLVPLFAIVANERRGLGAFARSFALTRGSALKLLGVMLLYFIVILVVLAAATMVFGTIFGLILGRDQVAIVGAITAIVSAMVTAVFGVLQNVFSTQFYLAARSVRDPA